jgi:hypothetical protein
MHHFCAADPLILSRYAIAKRQEFTKRHFQKCLACSAAAAASSVQMPRKSMGLQFSSFLC